MPFLEYARDRASFLGRMAHLYPTTTPEYRKIVRAACETEELFAGNFRGNGEPTVTHSFAVTLIATERACVHHLDVILACILHDNREHVQELIKDGTCPKKFLFWNESIEESYGYGTETLLAAVTMPLVRGSRSHADSHRIFHDRFDAKAGWRDLFAVKTPDRVHNLRTLYREMGIVKIRKKITETKRFYLRYARLHDILVDDLLNALAWAEQIFKELEQEVCV